MKETNNHESRGHWEVAPRSSKPHNVKSILAIQTFRNTSNRVVHLYHELFFDLILRTEIIGDLFSPAVCRFAIGGIFEWSSKVIKSSAKLIKLSLDSR